MKHIILFILALVFSHIFYGQNIGVNLVIFEILILGILIYRKEIPFSTKLSKLISTSVLLSLGLIIFNNSTVSILVHLLNWIAFIGMLNHKSLSKLIVGLGLGLISIIQGLKSAVIGMKTDPAKTGKFLKNINFKLYIIPLIIVLIFMGLYRLSNPIFNTFISDILLNISDLFGLFNWSYFPLFILGLLILSPILYRKNQALLEQYDSEQNEKLERLRQKTRFPFHPVQLKNQYKSALFLFASLNLLLVLLLGFEIYNGWFNFQFTGQNLSVYVHQGTYILIFTILISIGLVLYYFKRNLNFIPNNNGLVKQANIWIVLNSILTFSVAVRCFHYIDNYGLTQKRIGLFTFLMAVIFGLISVYIKVNSLKTSAYLWRINILSSFILLNTLAIFNWDIIIGNYNVYHHNKTNVEIFYLSGLSDKVLYILETDEFKERYIEAPIFEKERIEHKKARFIDRWENQHWLSWNYADDFCYKQLIKKTHD